MMNPETSDKEGIKILTDVLVRQHVRYAVLSPGSRNAPLIIAFARHPEIVKYVIVDERSAAFFALGIAQQSGEPVALVCTSGTAVLNYGPAVAEAWYQRIPLIVISADRPRAWVDQDDSQTIRQKGALAAVVKDVWEIPGEVENEEGRWFVNRVVNDAVNSARQGRMGPVHINIPIREPLYQTKIWSEKSVRTIESVPCVSMISSEYLTALATLFDQCPRVMVLAAMYKPDTHLTEALNYLSALPNVVVLTETVAHIRIEAGVATIDRVLSSLPEHAKNTFAPDLLISFGGPLISRQIKTFLRSFPAKEQWIVDVSPHPADTFMGVSRHITCEPGVFFQQFSLQVKGMPSRYSENWKEQVKIATIRHERYINRVSWSDLKAFSILLPALPADIELQVSNGTPIRYLQLFDNAKYSRMDCNRGVSGIDGSVSTTVGASCVCKNRTVLITGDLSLFYDSNALWNQYVSSRLKIIVFSNGGGGIFRFLPGSATLPELEKFFEVRQDMNIEGYAAFHRIKYFQANNETELIRILPEFFSGADSAALLEIKTPGDENAEILRNYFKSLSC